MKYLNYTFRFIIFWIFLFLVNRIVFALFFLNEISNASFAELLTIVPKSIPLDISFISYLLVPIVVLLWINSFLKRQAFIPKVIYSVVGFFIVLTGIIAGGEVALYSEWNTSKSFRRALRAVFPFVFHLYSICISGKIHHSPGALRALGFIGNSFLYFK